MRKVLLVLLVVGCQTTNFPIGQMPPSGMSAAIQQEVIADAIEEAVDDLNIDAKASWESTAKVTITSPFSVYSAGGGGDDQGVIGYLRTMVELELTKKGFHVVGSDIEPDWDITIEVRTAGAEVTEEDFVVMQRNTLTAMVSFRVFIHNAKAQGGKPNVIAEAEAQSEPYLWRNTILYMIPMPDVKYRPMGEPSAFDRIFGLQGDVRAGFSQANQLRSTGFAQ